MEGWGSQGVVSSVVKLKLINIWLCEERALHRNSGADQGTGGEMALTPKLHISLSLYISYTPGFCPDLIEGLPRKSLGGLS